MVRSCRKAQIKRKLIPKARSGNSDRSISYDKIGRVRGAYKSSSGRRSSIDSILNSKKIPKIRRLIELNS